jgi:hypothetical protein
MCPARLLDFSMDCTMGSFRKWLRFAKIFEQATSETGRVLLFAVHTACSHFRDKCLLVTYVTNHCRGSCTTLQEQGT